MKKQILLSTKSLVCKRMCSQQVNVLLISRLCAVETANLQRSVRQKIFTVNCGGSVVSQAPARKGDQRGCLLQPPSCSGHDQCASVAAAKLHTKSVIRAHYFGLHIDFSFTKLPRTAEAGRKIALLALVWLLRNVETPPAPGGTKRQAT